MGDEDDRIILLTNRSEAVDEVSPNLRNGNGCEDLELQSPGYQVLKSSISYLCNGH